MARVREIERVIAESTAPSPVMGSEDENVNCTLNELVFDGTIKRVPKPVDVVEMNSNIEARGVC